MLWLACFPITGPSGTADDLQSAVIEIDDTLVLAALGSTLWITGLPLAESAGDRGPAVADRGAGIASLLASGHSRLLAHARGCFGPRSAKLLEGLPRGGEARGLA